MTINDNTLSTDMYTAVRTLLVNANLQTTNSTTGVTTNASVLAAYNDKSPNRPQVIIVPMTKSEDTFFLGSTEGNKIINIPIECYGKNTLEIDQLSDQIETALKLNNIVGVNLNEINSNYTFQLSNEQKYQQKTIVAVYNRR